MVQLVVLNLEKDVEIVVVLKALGLVLDHPYAEMTSPQYLVTGIVRLTRRSNRTSVRKASIKPYIRILITVSRIHCRIHCDFANRKELCLQAVRLQRSGRKVRVLRAGFFTCKRKQKRLRASPRPPLTASLSQQVQSATRRAATKHQ